MKGDVIALSRIVGFDESPIWLTAPLSQRGINLDGIKIIYEMKDKIEELQNKILMLENEISNQKIDSKNKEKEIHQSYKNEIVKKSDKSISK